MVVYKSCVELHRQKIGKNTSENKKGPDLNLAMKL